MSDHLGELAALYALGALEPGELAQAEAHLDRCDACRRLLAQAQADVTAMEEAQVQYEPPAHMRERLERSLALRPQRPRVFRSAWLAVAAAIVLALLPSGYLVEQNRAMHRTMTAEANAMARVASAPHRVASFNGMDAHVMYGNDGSWYFVVIRGARAGLQVVWPHDGTQTMLGTATQNGDVAVLYLPKSHRMDRLTLMRDGHVVGQAQLVF